MESKILNDLMLTIPTIIGSHSPGSQLYLLLKQVARREVESLFSEKDALENDFKPFGKMILPYYKMGAVDSLNLFDIDELIIFCFYWQNRKRYKKTLDIGANLGIHSIIMSKCGFEVRCFEPDPKHFEVLHKNIALNKCSGISEFNAAISSKSGQMEFIRVLGNTTSSHLAGSKDNPYGDLEKFLVKVEDIKEHIKWADFVKLDAEGHEKEIILATTKGHWQKTDAMIEVGNKNNAIALYDHFRRLGVNMFAQKLNWQKVKSVEDVPVGYKEGSLFVSMKRQMPWSE